MNDLDERRIRYYLRHHHPQNGFVDLSPWSRRWREFLLVRGWL